MQQRRVVLNPRKQRIYLSPVECDDEDQEEEFPSRPITRDYRRAPLTKQLEPIQEQATSISRPSHAFRWLVVGCSLSLACIILIEQALSPAIQAQADHYHYGDGKVTKVVCDLGRGAASDVYAWDANGQAELIVQTGNHIEAYSFTASLPSAVVLVQPEDRNGDGKVDLVLSLRGSSVETVMYNDGRSFRNKP